MFKPVDRRIRAIVRALSFSVGTNLHLAPKEIDFVLRRPERPLPIEAKIDFPRAAPPVFKSFWRSEPAGMDTPSLVVELNGEPTDTHMIYPWQL